MTTDTTDVAMLDAGAQALAVTPASTVMALIDRGLTDPEFDVAKLEHLLQVHERWLAAEARRAFAAAMAACKREITTIGKDTTADMGQGRPKFRFASLAAICDAVTTQMGNHGLSHSWQVDQPAGDEVSVTCVVTHADGHSEAVTLSSRMDTGGAKSEVQALGSTLTYLERYSLVAIMGVATGDMDDADRLPRDDTRDPRPPQAPGDWTALRERQEELAALASGSGITTKQIGAWALTVGAPEGEGNARWWRARLVDAAAVQATFAEIRAWAEPAAEAPGFDHPAALLALARKRWGDEVFEADLIAAAGGASGDLQGQPPARQWAALAEARDGDWDALWLVIRDVLDETREVVGEEAPA